MSTPQQPDPQGQGHPQPRHVWPPGHSYPQAQQVPPPWQGYPPPQEVPPPGQGDHRPQQALPKKKRPWWLNSIFTMFGGLLTLAVVVGIIVVLGSGGSKTSPAAPGAQGTAAPTPTTPLPAHRKITAREWQLFAKDPDAHKGERVIVYGQVTQLDAATGTDTMRASVDGVPHALEYGYVDYETNTVLSGNSSSLQNVIQGDLFQANVTVIGAISYDTQIGGSTTVPALTIDSIQGTGSAK